MDDVIARQRDTMTSARTSELAARLRRATPDLLGLTSPDAHRPQRELRECWLAVMGCGVVSSEAMNAMTGWRSCVG